MQKSRPDCATYPLTIALGNWATRINYFLTDPQKCVFMRNTSERLFELVPIYMQMHNKTLQ